MKRSLIFIGGILLVLLAACGGGAPSSVEVPPVKQPTPIPPQPVIQPTDTLLPPPSPTATPVPPTASPSLFRDDFDGKLGEGWSWIAEDATHWNLTDTPGFVRIIAQRGAIGGDAEPRNFLVRAAPAGNFEIETHLIFEPTSNFQIAGLLIYEAQGKALQFGRAFARCNFPDFCKDNALYFDNPTQQGLPNFVTPISNPSNVWLRLRREGNVYKAFYSEDGSQWTGIGQHTASITPVYVGLIADQAFEEEKPADFDYFLIRAVP